jgi:anti-anti-sigma factor
VPRSFGESSGEREMERRRSSDGDNAYQDRQLTVTSTAHPVGLRFVGAVDATNVDAVKDLLSATLQRYPGTELHVDVSGLEFADVSGIRALVTAAQSADDSRRFVLYGMAPLMTRVMDAVGWTDLPALNISHNAFPENGVNGEL